MKLLYNVLNYEIGFFIKKRFSLNSLFTKITYDEINDECNKNYIKNEWKYDASIDKRFHAITGYNIEKKFFDDKGLIHWLFRDVDNKCLECPYESVNIIDLSFMWIKNWRMLLLKNNATEKQIYTYNMCVSELFKNMLIRISGRNQKLYRFINNEFYMNSIEYMILTDVYKEDD